jgi:hypothetical protein
MPGSAGERRNWGRRRARAWCTPIWWAPGRAAARALPPHVPLVASEHTPRARDAARRVDLLFANGPSARAWVARIGLDDGRLRDGRSSVEGLSAAALPDSPRRGGPSPAGSAATRHQMCSSRHLP